VDEWLDRLADEVGVERLSRQELGAILKLTREVAHSVERRLAPLSAFVLGVAVGRRTAGGVSRDVAFDGAVSAAQGLLPSDGDGP
jgi:hypothetical protein